MGVARSFRDLRVYQLARKAVSEIFETAKGFPREERHEQQSRFATLLAPRRRSLPKDGRDGVTAQLRLSHKFDNPQIERPLENDRFLSCGFDETKHACIDAGGLDHGSDAPPGR